MAAASRDKRRGHTRTSVDCVLSPSAPSADALKATQRASLGNRPTLMKGSSAGQRWRPEVARIASGQDLQALEAASSAGDGSAETSTKEGKGSKPGALDSGKQLDSRLDRCASAAVTLPSIAGTGAVDCLKNEATDPLMRPDISVAVPEVHLLQLGALLGEQGAQWALKEKQQQGENCPAGPGPSTFLGTTDDSAQYAEGWEPLIEEHRLGLHYWAWRRYLRKGLFMYKSRTVFEGGVTVPQLAAFNFDWRFKQASDDSCACMHPMLPPGCSVGNNGSCADAAGTGAALFLAAAATCPDPAGALGSLASAPTAELNSSGAETGALGGGGSGGGVSDAGSGIGGAGSSGSGTGAPGNGVGDSGVSGGDFNRAGGSGGSQRASVTGGEGEGGPTQGGRQLERVPSNSSSASASSSCRSRAQGMPVSAAVCSLEEELESRTFNQSCYMYSRTRFPPPMAARQYIYARRVWLKTDDGGCYVVSRAAPDHPCPPPLSGRAVNVDDMVSGYVIRSAHGIYDRSSPAAEMVSLYYEDSRVSPGVVNLGVRKALWPIVQKMNEALRTYEKCTGPPAEQTSNSSSKLAKAAAAVRVRSDHAVARHQRVLQRYGTMGFSDTVCGSAGSGSHNVCGSAGSGSDAVFGSGDSGGDAVCGSCDSGGGGGGDATAAGICRNASGRAAVSGTVHGGAACSAPGMGVAGVAGSRGAMTAAAAAVAAAEAAAFEEEALVLRAFDAGTLLPRQSRGGRLLPALYRAYLGTCTVVGGAARGLLYTARLALRFQLTAHRVAIASLQSGLRTVVLSHRYATLCAWLQQLSVSGAGAGAPAVSAAPNAFARGWVPPVPGRSGWSGGGLGYLVMGWRWVQSKGAGVQDEPGARSKLSSHPLQIRQSQQSFRSHPLCAMSIGAARASEDPARGEEGSKDGGAAEDIGTQKGGRGPGMPTPRSQPQRSGGGRYMVRRLVAKGASFALRAAALPLMHRALRACANDEDAGGLGESMAQQQKGGSKRQQQQQQQYEELEDAEAAEQLSLRRAQWLSAVAHSSSGSSGVRGYNGSGNGRSVMDGNISVLPPLSSRHSCGEASTSQQHSSTYNSDGTLSPSLMPRSSSKAQASQASSHANSPAGMRGGGEEGGGVQGRAAAGGRKVPQHVQSFSILPSNAFGQDSWSEGFTLAEVEGEGGRASALRNSYRRARSSLQFGGPSLVVEGVPMTPDPPLSRRFSAKSSTSDLKHGSAEGTFSGADDIWERRSMCGGSRQDGVARQGKGRERSMASNSSTTDSRGAALGKQRLTLSEMGMLHGAFCQGP
ncbi:hypothetical protein DUNSADRAFT_3210 [Dunaliella salina]|uniref:START domain-containing protein n=1 Tax=Dunaliella salina TaxID=3046 RepID=A0ABQ7GUH0_DUNSA|nr:hypothetical protein DUNSADRAFT_3210 [Dunaliella salina]|eukprot:KAF5838230.1 hypothetical protein DUNSADRAFT_3210 [Dunaliella salina]